MLQTKRTEQYIKINVPTESAKNDTKLKFLISPKGIKQNSFNPDKTMSIHVLETVKDYIITNRFNLKTKNNFSKTEVCVLFLIDSSGSMVKDKQIAFIKGLVEQTIEQYKQKRLKYAAVSLSNGEAQLLSPLTLNTSELICTIEKLTTGGKTNLKAGFYLIKELIKTNIKSKINLYIFTDGKINAGDTENPFNEAVVFYKTFLKSIKEVKIIDNENGFIKLGLSGKLANEIGASYIQLTHNTN